MRQLDELPAFHPAGGANILLRVAQLSGGHYIEQPAPQSWLPGFLYGLLIGAAVTFGVMAL